MDHSSHFNHASHKALVISAWLTGVYFFVELAIGIHTQSIAVLSDAFHTFSAAAGVVLAIVAGKIAARPATKYKSFGLLRAEIVGALFNGFFLLGMALFIVFMGWNRLFNPIDLPTLPMFLAAIGGLFTEFISLGLLRSHQKDNLNVKGAYWHVIQTFVGSLLIIVTAITIQFTDFVRIDPILGMLFGVTLLYASYGIIRDSLRILLESAPPEIDINEIKNDIEALPGVKGVHHIHAWQLTSGKNVFSSHVLLKDMKHNKGTLKKINKLLKSKYKFYFSTVQLEDELNDLEGSEHIDIT